MTEREDETTDDREVAHEQHDERAVFCSRVKLVLGLDSFIPGD